jgi:hypothetical protein
MSPATSNSLQCASTRGLRGACFRIPLGIVSYARGMPRRKPTFAWAKSCRRVGCSKHSRRERCLFRHFSETLTGKDWAYTRSIMKLTVRLFSRCACQELLGKSWGALAERRPNHLPAALTPLCFASPRVLPRGMRIALHVCRTNFARGGQHR